MKQESERKHGLAAYDALDASEQSEIQHQHPRYCYAKGWQASAARFEAVVGAVSRMFDGLSTSIITIEDDSEFHANLEDLRHALDQLEAK